MGRLDKGQRRPAAVFRTTHGGPRLTDPATGPDKTYHVQVDRIPDATPNCAACVDGIECEGAWLRAKSDPAARRRKNAWLEIAWTKAATGRSGACWRRSTSACCGSLRVAIGTLQLGDLPKGAVARVDRRGDRRCVAVGRPAGRPYRRPFLADAGERVDRAVEVLARAPRSSACGCAPWPFATTGKKKPIA